MRTAVESRPRIHTICALIGLTLAMSVAPGGASAGQEFAGKIAKSYADSEEWWPDPVEPSEGAPNVIIFLLDDTGFAQIESFGGLVETPRIDRLAENGLRYTYSLAETFDVGRDTGTQVSRLYDDPFPFEGALDRVVVTLTE